MKKPILVKWREGKGLLRLRGLGFKTLRKANKFVDDVLQPSGRPYVIYRLIREKNWW